jgi:uncharacterized protein
MLSQLPVQADPRRLCEQGKTFAGSVALRKLPRLTPLLASSEGEAAFTLEFGQDRERRARIRGHVQAPLPLLCQRCLQQMVLQVDAKFQLSPVDGPREAEMLPAEYDPLMLDEPLLQLLDLIEDELILAIPPAPRHAAAECPAPLGKRKEAEEVASDQGQVESPFAMLAKLKRDNTDE